MKRFKVLFDINAEEDLFDILSFVAKNDSITRAQTLLLSLKKVSASLQFYPNRGRVLPELTLLKILDFREIFYKPYRIVYSIESRIVFVHCVLDGRRDLQDILQRRLTR